MFISNGELENFLRVKQRMGDNNIKLSKDTSLIWITVNCRRCRRMISLGSHKICRNCNRIVMIKLKQKLSGNKIIDDFIKLTRINYVKTGVMLEFVPHEQFKNIEFIAEGGFSKIYKATWIDGPFMKYNKFNRRENHTVVLKKLNNSKNITSKELNEVRTIF